MALALSVSDVNAVPESFRSLYVEKDGAYHLDVDGVPDVSGLNSALKSEREQHKAAAKQAKELAEKFGGVDLDAYKKWQEQSQSSEEQRLLAQEGGLDKIVSSRTEKMKAAFDKQLQAALAERDAASEKSKRFMNGMLESQFRAAVSSADDVFPSAVDDAVLYFKQSWSLDENGKAVKIDSDGSVILGKDAKTPYSLADELAELREKRAHWFKATGTGSGNTQSPSGRKSGVDISKMTPMQKLEYARTQKT